MEEIMKIIYKYSPMNGACNKIMKNSIHEFETSFRENLEDLWYYFNGNIPVEELESFYKEHFQMSRYYLNH